MKLSDWAKTQGIAYLTAYRWFKDGKLPVKAYQSESGTIIIQLDESGDTSEQQMASNINPGNDAMSLFLKKTVEFSKNSATVEDFAAYVISNFQIKLNNATPDTPKYSKNKPKPEEVRKHFDQFLKPKGEKPAVYMAAPATSEVTSDQLYKDLSSVLNSKYTASVNSNRVYGNTGPEGVVIRSFETPHNYTDSTDDLLETPMSEISDAHQFTTQFPAGATGGFMPTEKELRLSKSTESLSTPTVRARRGRKSKESLKGSK